MLGLHSGTTLWVHELVHPCCQPGERQVAVGQLHLVCTEKQFQEKKAGGSSVQETKSVTTTAETNAQYVQLCSARTYPSRSKRRW